MPEVRFRTSTSEVRISFFATDEDNRPVEHLDQNDFVIIDGDIVIRDFRSLTRSTETALDVTVLVDSSESVSPRFGAVTDDVVHLVSETSQPAGDAISVIAFSGLKPSVLCSSDCGPQGIAPRLASIKPSGVTPLFDSLLFTARFISARQNPAVRQVLILFSDGNDTISLASSRAALNAIADSGALVYAIDMNSPRRPSNGSAVLRQLAESTGGRYFSMRENSHDVLETAIADLRASYVVTYQLPRRTAGFRSLRILPKHNSNLKFHCRRGYFQ